MSKNFLHNFIYFQRKVNIAGNLIILKWLQSFIIIEIWLQFYYDDYNYRIMRWLLCESDSQKGVEWYSTEASSAFSFASTEPMGDLGTRRTIEATREGKEEEEEEEEERNERKMKEMKEDEWRMNEEERINEWMNEERKNEWRRKRRKKRRRKGGLRFWQGDKMESPDCKRSFSFLISSSDFESTVLVLGIEEQRKEKRKKRKREKEKERKRKKRKRKKRKRKRKRKRKKERFEDLLVEKEKRNLYSFFWIFLDSNHLKFDSNHVRYTR